MEFQKNMIVSGESHDQEYQNKYDDVKSLGDRWKKTKNTGLSIFIAKTFQILQNNVYNDIASWNEQGTTFTIVDVEKFQSLILPIYFRHRNFSSFVRQLNMYDFHKIRNQKNLNMFEHKQFRRNSKQSLYKIKRKGCLKKQTLLEVDQQQSKHIPKSRVRVKQAVIQNSIKSDLLQQFINTLPEILHTEIEIQQKIKELKHNPKYKCLSSKDDIRKIYKKLKHRKLAQKEELQQLSIEQEIMVQNIDSHALGIPSLAILSSDKFLPPRSVSLIASLNQCDEIDNLFCGNNIS